MPPHPYIRSLQLARRPNFHSYIRYYGQGSTSTDKSTSAKLFADAAEEERSHTSTPLSRTQELAALHASKQRNWDGDEVTEDAVLRMLVDKYKPLRTGNLRTADDKLKEESNGAGASVSLANSSERGGRISLSSLAPIPSPTSFSGNQRFKPSGARSGSGVLDSDDAKVRAEGRRAKKLNEGPRRVGSALEKSLDYRIGRVLGQGQGDGSEAAAASSAPAAPLRQINPVSLKGWASVVEEKIEQARSAGVFNKVEGRGRPLKRHHDESNPFIPREEFLMNRIIRGQGAAPAWVEIQGELENHIRLFRNIIRQSWVRAATRNILLSLPPPPYPRTLPPHLTVESIVAMRDPAWEKRELSYHEAALDEVDAQIRRHNGIAPFAARRGYLMRQFELEKCYEESAEEILENVKEKLKEPAEGAYGALEDTPTQLTARGQSKLWEILRRLVMRLMPAPAPMPPSDFSGDAPSGSDAATRDRRMV
ncbi:hypothetical protein M407DRAFT_28425 [Tulasnella calospora MUT 4182]|uniref:DnaJ homologue subfamily C member 28 conserved domain-containing protein n=1 Tax=Tulasnella calospora MUT 4182 TaxID=1051891 RepID=A0A0C3QAQ1_9AGAM|nr:hypothetical protein M407DRAFT_28425 [Tulasnella calospora MUT 4182]